jgi:DNA adenine methylase
MAANENLVDRVILGELDADVASVWSTIFSGSEDDCEWLCRQIQEFVVTENHVRAAIDAASEIPRERAWRTIVRNRMQRGGIMAPGAGLIKGGENGKGLRSRWYPETLVARIRDLRQIKSRIQVFFGDAFELIARYKDDKNAVFLVDPPYTADGKRAGTRLYAHHAINHEKLVSQLANIKGHVMLTYDENPAVIALANRFGFSIARVPMKSSHHEVHKELVMTR